MIKNVQNNLSHILTKDIENDTIINLLQEDDTIHNKRVKLLNEKKLIEDIKELINSI